MLDTENDIVSLKANHLQRKFYCKWNDTKENELRKLRCGKIIWGC